MPVANHGPMVSTGTLRQPAVLIVEDNDDARSQVACLLRGWGYSVTEASDGREGLQKLRAGPVDLVLLDLRLPVMDGWSFRAEQRAEKALSEIPVVVMTADGSAQAQTIHADAILRKPFESESLCRTIREVLAAKEAEVKGATRLVSEALNLLAGAMGHEIGNALVGLNFTIENARESGAPPENLDVMVGQSRRIGNSLRTLRGLSCPPGARERPVDFDKVVRSAIERANADGTARIAFEGDETAWILGDPLVLTYVCTALVRNALEAIPRSRHMSGSGECLSVDVDVQLRASPNEVVLDVRDFGAPIPEDELIRIFSLNNPGRERAWGAGIRLWFVRQIVEPLGGVIEVSNLPEGGVRCRVRLPAAPQAGATDERAH